MCCSAVAFESETTARSLCVRSLREGARTGSHGHDRLQRVRNGVEGDHDVEDVNAAAGHPHHEQGHEDAASRRIGRLPRFLGGSTISKLSIDAESAQDLGGDGPS